MTTKKNWPLLTKVVSHIIEHPETWDQTVYANTCGTAFCVAGHAAVMFGGKQLQIRDVHPNDPTCQPGGDHEDLGAEFTDRVMLSDDLKEQLEHLGPYYINNAHISMSVVGEAALGLNHLEANLLFDGNNELGDILLILGHWADEDDIELPSTFFDQDDHPYYDWEVINGELYRNGRNWEGDEE